MITMDEQTYRDTKTKIRTTRHGINSLAAWDLAKMFGLSYTGDRNLEHGGTFYDISDWQKYEYADAVGVSVDDGHVFITVGQVNRIDVDKSLASCGWHREGDQIIADHDGSVVGSGDAVPHVEFSACEGYFGIEPESGCGWCFPITESLDGDTFRYRGANIPMDNLQGWVFKTFVAGYLIALD